MNSKMFFLELRDLNNFDEYIKYVKLLSNEKQIRILKYRFDVDKKLSLLSDLFVRYYLCQYFNIKNSELVFGENRYGKPFLLNYNDLHYNISHTRNAIAIGFCQNPIGIDIESIGSSKLQIAERFFCSHEVDYILSKPMEQNRTFFEVWTKKEAYIKYLGKGLSIPLNSFDVTDNKISNMFKIFTLNNYIVSICTAEDLKELGVIKLNESQIEKIIKEFYILNIN